MFTRNWWASLATFFTKSSGANFTALDGTIGRGSADTSYNTPSWGGITSGSSDLSKIRTVINYNTPGVVFGDGDTPVSFDDYKLSGNVVDTITGTAAINHAVDDNGITSTGLYTLTNTSDTEITIREVGLFSRVSLSPTGGIKPVMYERTVLDSPVTIPAGGVGQVTYTIRMNYPTA